MQLHKSRPAAVLRALLALALSAVAAHAFAASLTVNVTGLKDASGTVAIAVYGGPDGFPDDDAKAVKRVAVPIDDATKSARAVIPDLPAGTYAIATFHDNNNSGKLERNLFGMPKKGYGFSNNPRPSMRAARYDEARFDLPESGASVDIELMY